MAVYIVGPVMPAGPGPYKIGYTSKDGEIRLSQLQCGSPVELQIVMWFPKAGKGVETRLHRFFAGKRGRGEWFDLSVEDFLFLDLVSSTDVLETHEFMVFANVYVRQELDSDDTERKLAVSALVMGWTDRI